MSIKAKKIIITGLVQGVGFRPFVHRLANQHGIKGYVKNLGGNEVEIWIEGQEQQITGFLKKLQNNPPPNAIIENIRIFNTQPKNFTNFTIKNSSKKRRTYSMLPPDISICTECIKEIEDPKSRFYKYPFHSCVNCGPRYSMMYKPPYDRANTSMTKFPLCNKCKKEYNDPENQRRFHAQGISCPICGPKLKLLDNEFNEIKTEDPIKTTAKLIEKGYIIAIKGIGGYHIATLATHDDTIMELRKRKKRKTKPFALMALDIETIGKHAFINSEIKELLQAKEKPIVLLKKKKDSTISNQVAPGLKTIGIMLPYSALHYLLLKETRDKVLIMTSANITGEPMCKTLDCIKHKLKNIIDYTLDHNREIVNRVDDSVIKPLENTRLFIRRARGYAPRWITIKLEAKKPVIALGGFLNNTGAIAFENKIILTPYIGDLESYSAIKDLFTTINKYIKWYGIDKEALIIIDKHPLYPQKRLLEKYIEIKNYELKEIQHHHAHGLQVIGEYTNPVSDKKTVITLDGTGYGDDGNIWGGEILSIHGINYKRNAQLEYQPYIGGDVSIKYPARFLLQYLYNTFRDSNKTLKIYNKYVRKNSYIGEDITTAQYISLIENNIEKSKKTSSIGRILDAFSVLLGFAYTTEYDGEPALKLEENSIHGKLIEKIDPILTNVRGRLIIETNQLLEKAIEYLDKNYKRTDIGYTLQWNLGYSLGIAASEIDNDNNEIYISGGAAVNEIILKGIKEGLSFSKKKIILPESTPPGDGGLSFGQAVYGALLTNESM